MELSVEDEKLSISSLCAIWNENSTTGSNSLEWFLFTLKPCIFVGWCLLYKATQSYFVANCKCTVSQQ